MKHKTYMDEAPMETAKICTEQTCNIRLLRDTDYLCGKHWRQSREGAINRCPQCRVFKDSRYLLCIECNKNANAKAPTAEKASPAPAVVTPQTTRRYDSAKPDTFAERSALLEDDRKAKDKRQLFHDQQRKCVYCGNVYRYDELEIEHIIPKILGGPDNIRNCQLACKTCNLAKGTMTDIEFRQKNSKLLPQEERTPANPPIKPELLKAPVQNRPYRRFQRK